MKQVRLSAIALLIIVTLALTAFAGQPTPSAAPLGDITDNLVAYWKLDETSGQRLDSVGSSHLSESGTLGAQTGIVGTAAWFNGGYLKVTDNSALSMGDFDFTVTSWVRFDDVSGFQTILGKWKLNQAEYIVEINGGQWVFAVSPDGTHENETLLIVPWSLVAGQWYFVAAWHDEGEDTLNLQINNGEINSLAYSSGVYDGNAEFEIGKHNLGLTAGLEGRVDEVGIWKRLLTEEERDTIYNSSVGCSYPFAPCADVTVVQSTGNYLQDGSFETFPPLNLIGFSPWASSWLNGTVNRLSSADGDAFGSTFDVIQPLCGQYFWQTDAVPGQIPVPGIFDHTGTYTEQEFAWPGGNMYLSLGAMTSNTGTFGVVQLQGPNGVTVLDSDLDNTTGDWQMFHYARSDMPAGTYTLQVKTGSSSGSGQLIVDAASVHEGWWSDDCGVPPQIWALDPAQAPALVTPTPQAPGPTNTPNFPLQTSDAGTRVAAANSTSQANATATSQNGATRTQNANATATSLQATSARATQNAAATQTQISIGLGGGTGTLQAAQTHAAQATANARSALTATAFVAQFRATLTAIAAGTRTQVAAALTRQAAAVQTLIAVQTGAAVTARANATATAAAIKTQTAQAPIWVTVTAQSAQLTQQAALFSTNQAILTEQAQAQQTAIAQITSTADATAIANATTVAQIQLTLQSLATAQALQATQAAQGTITAPIVVTSQSQLPLPPVQPPVGDELVSCVYPDNPLNLAWWIDYALCQILRFFSWNSQNTAQFNRIIELLKSREPFATIMSLADFLQRFGEIFMGVDWDSGLVCTQDNFDFFGFAFQAPRILWGDADILPGSSGPPIDFECGTAAEVIVGPHIAKGICIGIHYMCVTGMVSMMQVVLNVVVVIAFVYYLKVGWVDQINS